MTIDPERWRRVEALFHEALERDPQARAAFLDEQCAGDPALRVEVEQWLAADAGGPPSYVADFVASAVRSLPTDATLGGLLHGAAPPETIGPYRIVRELGHGGMGAVYLAERADDQFRQRVAIKLVRHTIDSPLVRARFLQERQLLAQLNHPGIARLLDGGATDGGHPYFAMEYVEGRPLLEFCEDGRLGMRARLELFRHVCAAVQYAHQNLVVHRDIKPANILVTAEGLPKLLDFGIAKLIEQRDDAAASNTTLLLLTPDYASPEQVRGEAVTTGTDVYSLGCVLYELVTGSRPHAFATRTPGEFERVICEVDPPPPSRFAPLDEDLDNIVLKALRKDPAMRYATAEQLADDLRRYLEGRPVSARPPTVIYRAAKFVRRNRMAVGAVAAGLAAVFTGAGAAVWQARQASAQRAIAERRASEGRRLANTVLFSVEEKIRNLSGTMEARRLIMESGVRYLDDLSREAAGDALLQLELARAYERIGEVQGTGPANLGQVEAARASFERSIALLENLGDGVEVRRTLASVYLKHHMVLQRTAQPDAARQSLRQSIAIAGPLLAAEPGNAELYRILSTGYAYRATIESRIGNSTAALEATRQALTLTRGWAASHPGEASDAALAAAHERLAVALSASGDLTAARTACQELIRLREKLAGDDGAPAKQVALARAYNIYGDVLGSPLEPNWGETAEAMRQYEKALAIREALMANDPTSVSAAIDVAFTLLNVAALEKESTPDQAVRTMHRAVEISRRAFGEAPTNVETRRSLALVNMMHAAALARAGRHNDALALYPAILEVLEAMRAREPARVALQHELMNSYGERGDLLMAMNRSEAALADYQRALAVAAAPQQPGNVRVRVMLAATYERLQHYYQLAGDWPAACEWAGRAGRLWQEWSQETPSVFSRRGSDRLRPALASCGQ